MKSSFRKIFNFFFFVFFLSILIPFAISNKDKVTVIFSPLPFELQIPLYLLILILFFVAFILGYIFSKIKK